MPRDPNSGGTGAHQDKQLSTSPLAVISWPPSLCWLDQLLPPHLYRMGSPTLLQGPDGAMGSPITQHGFLCFLPAQCRENQILPCKTLTRLQF